MILPDVVATVSTRNRNTTTLPLVITSLICQEWKPSRLVVYDDNDEFKDPRENQILNNVLQGLVNSGINWHWVPGGKCGQVFNHERARNECTEEFIWRIDDDNILPNNVLKDLYPFIKNDSKVGAVGPSILDPKNLFNNPLASNKIEDIFLGLNVQWNYEKTQKVIDCDHLQGSTFLYRKTAGDHGYCMNLSKVGHREETLFTYGMKRKGWKLLAICGVNTWHMRYSDGGIRSSNVPSLFEHDEVVFKLQLNNWGVRINKYKFIYLNNGRGDHYAFKCILDDLTKKYKDHTVIIGACYQDVFNDIEYTNLKIVNMESVKPFIHEDDHNIYKVMAETKWKGSLTEAFRKLYV